jgi:tyrosine phenol-lyase
MTQSKPVFSPYLYNIVKKLPLLSEQERRNSLEKAGYNVINLKPNEISFDLFTDSGNSSKSIEQLSSIYMADDGPIRISEIAEKLENSLIQLFGYPYVDLYPQGRSAEQAFNKLLVKFGQIIPGNMTFSTTQYHQQSNGGKPISVVCEEAFNLKSNFVFKGNIDISNLRSLLEQDPEQISYVNIELCSNAIGGYPISMKNLGEVYQLTSSYNIPLILDSTRILENAKFIQVYEDGYKTHPISSIVRQICNLSDGCVMSLKKDFLTPTGGFIGVRDSALYSKLRDYSLVSGSEISGTDLALIHQGLKESVYCEEHMDYRYYLTKKLFHQLKSQGVPVVEPLSCHGVWLNVSQFTKDSSESKNPHIWLQNALYLEGGVRAGSGSFSNQKGELIQLIRLTLPHRLYDESHINFIAYSVLTVWNNRDKQIDYEMAQQKDSILGKMVTHYIPANLTVRRSGTKKLVLIEDRY